MNHLNQKKLEDTAKVYEEMLVPALFQEWADRLATTEEIKSSHKILDVACGTGVLTRTVNKTLSNGSITGLDPNPGMLTVARQVAPDIDWRQGTAEEIPFREETFDVVLSQFGLMLFSSPKAGLLEMKRVLKTNGWVIVAVFDSIDNIPAYEIMANLFERNASKPVGEALRGPFSMGDTAKLNSMFADAGLHNLKITTHKGFARFSSPRHMVLSDVQGWFPFAQIHLDKDTIESIVRQAETELKPFISSDGSLEFETSVHIIKSQKLNFPITTE